MVLEVDHGYYKKFTAAMLVTVHAIGCMYLIRKPAAYGNPYIILCCLFACLSHMLASEFGGTPTCFVTYVGDADSGITVSPSHFPASHGRVSTSHPRD